jgi:hypothetical protein
MKKLWLLVAIIWLALIAVVLAAPKIQVDQKEWNYGTVCRNATIRHAFVVRNVGDSTLTIKKVKPG